MKHLNKLIMVLFALGVTACGNQQNPNSSMYGQTIVGYGPNGQPIYGNAGSNTCLTNLGQGLSLNFSATGLDDVGGRFFAGNVPQYWTAAGAHGSVTLAGGYQQGYGAISLQKSSQGGSVQMTLNPQQRTAFGQIQINSTALMSNPGVLAAISGQQYGGQYNQYNNSNICVTGIALDVGYSAGYGGYGNQMTTGQLGNVLVFLYLSNGQVAMSPVQI